MEDDIRYFAESAYKIVDLKEDARNLIIESCGNPPYKLSPEILLIPDLLKKKISEKVTVESYKGKDFPDISEYDLVISCRGCTLNRKEREERIGYAIKHNIPMTNFGVIISYLNGILDRLVD